MGWLTALSGLGGVVRQAGGVAEAFVGNKAKQEAAEHAEFLATINQLAMEYEQAQTTWFDGFINGLNRLPRPSLALGTMALFGYAMYDPIGFAGRMQGLALVPDQLWWLLGAVVSFYFGARELHYLRDSRTKVGIDTLVRVTEAQRRIDALRPGDTTDAPSVPGDPADPEHNAALEEWRASRRA